ncbi:uncharacterized protein VTP21DRAFT_2253 [Calcarisporiella thermophila]|uniref:uncharacterized protein n=1 Tax=Calcarisporiella thermophila TaxID=911321 RepID=UPI0037420182
MNDDIIQCFECLCCYEDTPSSAQICCSAGHPFCHQCLSRSVSEGLFGQGHLARQILSGELRVPCLTECSGCFDEDEVKSVLQGGLRRSFANAILAALAARANRGDDASHGEKRERKEGEDNEEELAAVPSLRCSGGHPVLPLSSPSSSQAHPSPYLLLLIASLIFWHSPLLFSTVSSAILLTRILRFFEITSWSWRSELSAAIDRTQKRRQGWAYGCRCGKWTCWWCGEECKRGGHMCKMQMGKEGMQRYIERAMTGAIKRTCPKCYRSFQKEEGCNKLTCHCNFVMCYVCGQGIQDQGYAHYCTHFLPPGSPPCSKCSKCGLYTGERDEEVVERAGKQAMRNWLREHGQRVGMGMGWSEYLQECIIGWIELVVGTLC